MFMENKTVETETMSAAERYMSMPVRKRIKNGIIHTSVDDARTSLQHVDDLGLVMEILEEVTAMESPRKTLVKHLKTRIRQLGGVVPKESD